MPNIMNQELVRAFNIILCHNEVAITNLTVQSTDQTFLKKEDRIVISFDNNMDVGQCMEYLHNIKESIVETFFGSESGANMSFNTKFFPFNFNERQLTKDKEGYKFLVPIDKGVVFNLKCLLVHGLAKDAKEDMGNEFGESCMEGRVCDVSFDRKSYLYCMQFYDKRLQDYFVESFSSRIKNYKNGPKKTDDFLKIKGNCVYIKESIFNNAEFIKDIVKHKASLECRDFEVTSAEDETVESLKFPVIYLLRKVGIPINSVLHVSYTGSGENSVLIPATNEVIGNIIYYKILSKEQADDINKVFGMAVLNNIESYTSPKHLPVFGSRGIYGIDFYDKDISYCVLNKIIESSVINKDHELSIDPELRLQALSPAQSPFNSPTHAGPSGLRTPPNQRKEDGDSGYDSNSPPKPKDSVAHSSSGGPEPSTKLSDMEWESPTCSQDGALKDSPRRGSEQKQVLHDHVDVPGTSKGFSPSPQLNSIAVSYGVPVPSSSLRSLGAAQNVQAGTSAWDQPIGAWSSPAPSAGLWSWKGAQAGANISEKEKELFEKLLYTLNLMNYTLDGVHTNFFAKDGKIVSLLHDNVDREEYLQKVRDYIIEEYCEDEEEARKLYDLDEFPFKFFPDPDYKKNQSDYEPKKTVVANISSGALSNLKILFSQRLEENVDAIDISAVKKVEKREKDEWVDRQLLNKCSLEEACENCFPDEGLMKRIPIALEGDEYVLDRSRDIREVELLLKEQLRRLRDTSVAGKGESDNKPLTEEEKELFKALLYAFNYSNHDFDLPDTNFIVKNGKIASLIPDSVNVKEYLQEVRDKTKKEYCKDKKEAYDLDEFPFKFLSNCKKNQETTVVAEISRGALFNLEKLFIYGYKEEVKIEKIDINIVKEAVKSRKHRLVERKVKEGIERKAGHYSRIKPYEAATASYPDESALEGIPIIEDKGGYCLDRTYEPSETKLFVKDLGHTEDRSKAGKVKPEDNKDSGISSGEATDAENVSSKAGATTSSGYESMDCENPPTSDQGNAGGGSPKRKPEEPLEGSPTKRLSRSGSSNSSSEKEGGSPHQDLIDPTLEQVRKRFDKARI